MQNVIKTIRDIEIINKYNKLVIKKDEVNLSDFLNKNF